MANLDQKIIMSATDYMTELLSTLGPARLNMAVVEPVAVPIPPVPPDEALAALDTDEEPNAMDIEAAIMAPLNNQEVEPMMDQQISIEVAELEHPAERNADWIDNKIFFNNIN